MQQDVTVHSCPRRTHRVAAVVAAVVTGAAAGLHLRDGNDLGWLWVGVAVIWAAKAVVSLRQQVVVNAQGVHRRIVGATRTVRWEDVVAVEDRGTDRGLRARMRVRPHEGASLPIMGGGTTEDELAVRRAIRTQATERGIPVEVR